MEDKIFLKQAKHIFSSLKTDPNSVLLSEEQIDKRLLKKSKKSKYKKDTLLLKFILLAEHLPKHLPGLISLKKEK